MIAVLLVAIAAGPSALWDDALHPNRARCAQLLEEGRHALAQNLPQWKLFDEATKLCPDQPDGFALLGAALIELGDFAPARVALERARVLSGEEGGDAALAFHLGFVRALGGDLAGSLGEYRRALQLGGLGVADNWLLFYDLGDTLMALGRLGEATEAYRRAARAAPLKAITHLALAVAYDRDGLGERSRSELGIALSQDPLLYALSSDQFIFVPAADRHYYLALGFFGRGLRARARAELRQFLAADVEGPYSARARERLAQAEAALPPATLELHRILDGHVADLERCIPRSWHGPLWLHRGSGRLRVVGHSEVCIERWLSEIEPLLPGNYFDGDFDLDLEVTPR
jgi:tetratricopeptide (TPR) repeat protein